MYTCKNCGKISDTKFCPDCGMPLSECTEQPFFDDNDLNIVVKKQSRPLFFERHTSEIAEQQVSAPSPVVSSVSSLKKICPECGCSNISYQFIVRDSKIRTHNRGCIWALGRATLILFTCGLWLLVGKSKGAGKIKNKNIKIAICQNCGFSWEVKS